MGLTCSCWPERGGTVRAPLLRPDRPTTSGEEHRKEPQEAAKVAAKVADKIEEGLLNAALFRAVRRLAASPEFRRGADLAAAVAERVAALRAGVDVASTALQTGAQDVGRLPGDGRLPPLRELVRVGMLGCGGFAKVELFEHPASGRSFAVKTLGKARIAKAKMQEAARYERLALLVTASPFVVEFFGSYRTTNTVELVQEALLGGELYATYQRNDFAGKEPHAKFYVACITHALRHLHSLHIVCRGIKLEDCVLDAEGWLKIVDLGLAKFVVNRTWTTCGTPDYFAPEIIASKGHDMAVDYWALGVVLFELLSGKPPFESAYPMQTYSKIMKGICKVPIPSAVTPQAKDLIFSLCQDDPKERLLAKQDGLQRFEQHGFFRGFDWTAFRHRTMAPPYVPPQAGLANFFARPEDAPTGLDWPYADDGSGWDADFGDAEAAAEVSAEADTGASAGNQGMADVLP